MSSEVKEGFFKPITPDPTDEQQVFSFSSAAAAAAAGRCSSRILSPSARSTSPLPRSSTSSNSPEDRKKFAARLSATLFQEVRSDDEDEEPEIPPPAKIYRKNLTDRLKQLATPQANTTSPSTELKHLVDEAVELSQRIDLKAFQNRLGIQELKGRGVYSIHSIGKEELQLVLTLDKLGCLDPNKLKEDKTLGAITQSIAESLGLQEVEIDPIEYILKTLITCIGIFKPSDEVRGGENHTEGADSVKLRHAGKDGVTPTSETPNEILAATLGKLDHPVISHTLDNHKFKGLSKKEGALIGYIPNAIHLPGKVDLSRRTIEKLSILDLRLVNADRHGGNALLSTEIPDKLHPIDHGLILPANFKSRGVFCWMSSEQARKPYTPSALKQIKNLHFKDDLAKILSLYPNYPVESLEVMQIAYYLLQKGAEAGLTPLEIGAFYTQSSLLYPPVIRSIYEYGREQPDDDPRKTFQIVIQLIDRAVADLKKVDLIGNNRSESNKKLKEIIENALLKNLKRFPENV